MTKLDEFLEKHKRWVCEFCYLTVKTWVLPSDWKLVWQAGVCPECQQRVAKDGGYAVVRGGAYATGPDPRAEGKEGIVAPTEHTEGEGQEAAKKGGV